MFLSSVQYYGDPLMPRQRSLFKKIMSSHETFKQNLYFHLKSGPAECGLTPVIYHDVRRFQYFFFAKHNCGQQSILIDIWMKVVLPTISVRPVIIK